MKSRPSMSATTLIKPRPALAATPVRVLWLQPPGEEQPLAERLRAKLASAGLLVYTMAFGPTPSEACRSFDLIVMRISTQTLNQVAANLLQIRSCNYAPIVMLTDQEPLEWSLVALPAGADAVMAVNTPEEIIIARCTALLRRWLATM